jgi:hypothetical protein
MEKAMSEVPKEVAPRPPRILSTVKLLSSFASSFRRICEVRKSVAGRAGALRMTPARFFAREVARAGFRPARAEGAKGAGSAVPKLCVAVSAAIWRECNAEGGKLKTELPQLTVAEIPGILTAAQR